MPAHTARALSLFVMQHARRALLPLFLALMGAGCVDAADDGERLSSTTAALASTFQTAMGARSCDPPHSVSAAPGEEGQWAAVRVGRVTANYRPTRLTYHFRGTSPAAGTWCSGNAGPHLVRVFYGPGPGLPPQLPTVVAEVLVPAANIPAEDTRAVVVDLRSGIVPANQHIYVAVEMVGDPATDTGYNCLAGCGPATRSTNYWSLETDAPYGWTALSNVGYFPMDIGMRVEGDYL